MRIAPGEMNIVSHGVKEFTNRETYKFLETHFRSAYKDMVTAHLPQNDVPPSIQYHCQYNIEVNKSRAEWLTICSVR